MEIHPNKIDLFLYPSLDSYLSKLCPVQLTNTNSDLEINVETLVTIQIHCTLHKSFSRQILIQYTCYSRM